MKFTINQISEGEEEVILNYKEMNEEVSNIVAFFKMMVKKSLDGRKRRR